MAQQTPEDGGGKRAVRQILPQDYYDSRQVMTLLKLSKQRYYELIEREDDPLPMRMYGWSTRGALAERGELAAWFKRNTLLARDGKKRRENDRHRPATDHGHGCHDDGPNPFT